MGQNRVSPTLCRFCGTLQCSAAYVQRGKLKEEQKTEIEMDRTGRKHVSFIRTMAVAWFSQVLGSFVHQPKPWLWPGFSCCFFLSLAKGRIKRRREARRKRGTHNSSKSDRKRKSERYTASGSKFPIKSVSDLGVKSSETFYFPKLGC